ncbi:HAD family hydrolase [Hymenobacter busanensis]|uniref:phosphoglycolate phosphatase n=1 Tax=Hymenobacter busanensis TaxID=2607656 RepID=A0A7L4ZXX7_9BACT|nr:HAD family hydrolase [Hymenobacter busanensis]KAA9325870.1 HAD family hydrolase [Hymenobacter busanensis]QHJ06290.1 HAD-IA family hydrolase [Hymenobacter busanensis]
MRIASDINWSTVKAVIFDVDGTLYPQAPLRRKMLVDLVRFYALRPWRLQEMLMLRRFRAEREKRPAYAAGDLANAQYAWCAAGTSYTIPEIKQVVERWMLRHPNQYLAGCMYPGTAAFFAALQAYGIKIGIYSDYPAHDKLAAMGLPADAVVSSTDAAVDRLKPDPRGLLYLAAQFDLAPEECLFIGDRPELDGLCAARAGMPFLLVDPAPAAGMPFFHQLHHQLTSQVNAPRYEPDIFIA